MWVFPFMFSDNTRTKEHSIAMCSNALMPKNSLSQDIMKIKHRAGLAFSRGTIRELLLVENQNRTSEISSNRISFPSPGWKSWWKTRKEKPFFICCPTKRACCTMCFVDVFSLFKISATQKINIFSSPLKRVAYKMGCELLWCDQAGNQTVIENSYWKREQQRWGRRKD